MDTALEVGVEVDPLSGHGTRGLEFKVDPLSRLSVGGLGAGGNSWG